MRIAAFGRTHWLYDSIAALRQAGHEIVLIGTCAAAPEYRVAERDFERLAEEIGCDYFCDSPLDSKERIALVRSLEADVAISLNWPALVSREFIALFRHGIVNAHAGDLPRFRGNACPNWAILTGEDKVVLTLHQMSEALDEGPILLKKAFPLAQNTYIEEVYGFLTGAIPAAFVEALAGLASGSLVPSAQAAEPSQSLRCFPRMPGDGEIAWELPAQRLARLVRASAEPFPGAFTHLDGARLTVWRARVGTLGYPFLGVPGQVAGIDHDSGTVAVLAGEGVLVLEEVETDGGRRKAAELIRSTRVRLGDQPFAQLKELEHKVEALEKRLDQLLVKNGNDC